VSGVCTSAIGNVRGLPVSAGGPLRGLARELVLMNVVIIVEVSSGDGR